LSFHEVFKQATKISHEDKVSLLKLGSAAAVSLWKRLCKVLSTMSSQKSTQSVRNIIVKQITAIDAMEDKKKESLPGFIKSLDEGNLFVLKFEWIPFLKSFSKVFSGGKPRGLQLA